MNRTSTAAILGFGGMGRRYLTTFEKLGVEVVAICDKDADRVWEHTDGFPETGIFDSQEALFDAVSPNIVAVATNSPSHTAGVVGAASAGVPHIMCEKPMATSLRDARRIIEVTEASGSRLAVNHVARWSHNQQRVKAAIEKGVIGPLRHMYFHCGSVGLANQGTHAFDKMRYLSGSDASWVVGVIDKTGTQSARGPQFVDPGGFGIVEFENGARGFIDTSEDTGVPYCLRLVGSYGTIEIDEFHNDWRITTRSAEHRTAPLTRYVMPLEPVPFEDTEPFDIVALTSRAIDELLGDGPVSCTGEDGYRSLELTLAFHVSDREGNRKVRLPLSEEYADLAVDFA